MDKLVSIIIPVYNVAKYLPACMESVLNQTYKNIEVIVVNDGSTDESEYILQEYSKQDDRISIKSQNNAGLSAARNRGINESKGDYIMFVDSDDLISRDMVKRFLQVAENSESDYVCSEPQVFFDGYENKVTRTINKTYDDAVDYEICDKEKILMGMFYQRPSITGAFLKLYGRSLFDSVRFPESRYYEDLATTYKFIYAAKKIAFIKEKHYAYRIRQNSIMTQKYNARKLDCLWVSRQIEKDFIDESIKAKNAAACCIFRLNRIVLTQMPVRSKNVQKVMHLIKKYRKSVIMNKDAWKYERLLAAISFMGVVPFKVLLMMFEKTKILKYRVNFAIKILCLQKRDECYCMEPKLP